MTSKPTETAVPTMHPVPIEAAAVAPPAYLTLTLVHNGRLDLDAPAGQYVNCLQVPGRSQPTVRQLLTHTAGLGNPLPTRWAHPADADPPDTRDMLRRLMHRRRAYRYPVGDCARYSNVGYLAIGEVIAAPAVLPFETVVQQTVLHPLAMNRTGFAVPAGTDTATGYVKAPRIADPLLRRLLPPGVAGERHGSFLALNPFSVDCPAYGGLVGSVLDAGRFLRLTWSISAPARILERDAVVPRAPSSKPGNGCRPRSTCSPRTAG